MRAWNLVAIFYQESKINIFPYLEPTRVLETSWKTGNTFLGRKIPYARDIYIYILYSRADPQLPIEALDFPFLSTTCSLERDGDRWNTSGHAIRWPSSEKVDRGRMAQNGSSTEARRTKSFLADIIGFRSSHIRSPVCVNALRKIIARLQ